MEGVKSHKPTALMAPWHVGLVRVSTQGSTVKVLVNFFQIKLDDDEEKTLVEEIVGSSFDHIAEGVEEIVGYGGLNRLKVNMQYA